MTQQNYLLGVPFNTYQLNDLTSDAEISADWTWPGRTLVGYVSADGNGDIIQLGQEIAVGTPTADLSGVWELNRLNLSVYIDNPGPDSYIEVSGVVRKAYSFSSRYYNDCLPLSSVDSRTAYEVAASATANTVCKFWFNTDLCGIIHPGENKTIVSVCYDSGYKNIDNTINPTNHGEVSSFVIGSDKMTSYSNPAVCINEVISVFLVDGGIMHYHSNKNSTNPHHPSLDD